VRTQYFKDPDFYERLGVANSLAGILDPQKHRTRRNILNPLFSKKGIGGKYHLVAKKVQRGMDFIRKRCAQNRPIDIELLFRRVAVMQDIDPEA
jgi:hypothetical protein